MGAGEGVAVTGTNESWHCNAVYPNPCTPDNPAKAPGDVHMAVAPIVDVGPLQVTVFNDDAYVNELPEQLVKFDKPRGRPYETK